MEIFKRSNLIEFAEQFRSDQDCREYLLNIKWFEKYVSRNCGHTKIQVRNDFDLIQILSDKGSDFKV